MSDLYYIEDDNFLTKKQKSEVSSLLESSKFPFYLQKECTTYDKLPYLSHIILKRPEDRKDNETWNSNYSDIFVNLVKSFTDKHNIKVKELYRMAINLTCNVGVKKGDIHLDHHYPHKQLIIYLSDIDDEKIGTVILDDNEKTVLKKVKYKKFKGVCFDNKPHHMIFPKNDMRIVCVCTFI